MHVLTVLSAGMEGAERGALLGANNCGMYVGGWVPAEIFSPQWRELLDGVKKSKKMDHRSCVRRNIRDAEGVLLIGRESRIARLVRRECSEQEKPLLEFLYRREFYYENRLLRFARTLSSWIYENDINFLFVTGARESDRVGIEGFTHALLLTLAPEMRERGILPHKVRESEREKKRRLRKERKEEKKRNASAKEPKTRRRERVRS